MALWAWDPRAWSGALDYRDRAISFEAPLVGLMVLDWWRRGRDAAAPMLDADRRLLVNASGLVFMAVLVAQSISWSSVTARLLAELDAAPGSCVGTAAVAMPNTAAEHWSKPTLAMALQGRSPSRLVLDPEDCAALTSRGVVRLNDFDTVRATGGWFRFPRRG
jgi:hypothetical protein